MSVTVAVPGSKSMTQRALVIAALADGPVVVRGAGDCGDTRHLAALLAGLGAGVEWGRESVLVTPGPLRGEGQVFQLGDAGTAVRFGAALSPVCRGEYTIDGDARMRERPLGGLIDALRALGVDVACLAREGFPPVRLRAAAPPPAVVEVDSRLSSQFGSGLLLAAPRLPDGLRLRFTGGSVSRPYLRMTVAMMRQAGARVQEIDEATVVVAPLPYSAAAQTGEIRIEPDWSAAAFILGAAELAGCSAGIPGLRPAGQSLQGDAVFPDLLAVLRSPGPHRFDLSDCPDLIAPLAACALFAAGTTEICGVAHARIKESDRVAVLCEELGKLGATIGEEPDGLAIRPAPLAAPAAPAVLDPRGDHRMAMAFGLVSLRLPGLRILDPACVGKSYPAFWEALGIIRRAGAERGRV